MSQLLAIAESARGKLAESDVGLLIAALKTLDFLQTELQRKGATVEFLKKMVFGPSSEKTSKVAASSGTNTKRKEKKKHKGHGRNGAQEYTGATKVAVPHPLLKAGDKCVGVQRQALLVTAFSAGTHHRLRPAFGDGVRVREVALQLVRRGVDGSCPGGHWRTKIRRGCDGAGGAAEIRGRAALPSP